MTEKPYRTMRSDSRGGFVPDQEYFRGFDPESFLSSVTELRSHGLGKLALSFEQAHIKLHPTCRLLQLIRYCEEKKVPATFRTGSPPLYSTEFMAQASIDTIQLTAIGAAFGSSDIIERREEFMALANGSAVESGDANSKSRDSQFSLYVGALLRLGGSHASVAEPDIFSRDDWGSFGIACKRPKTLDKLSRLTSDARHQIMRSKHVGVLALDVSRLILEPGTVFDSQDTAHSQDRIAGNLWLFWNRYGSVVARAADRNAMLGAVVFAFLRNHNASGDRFASLIGFRGFWLDGTCIVQNTRMQRLCKVLGSGHAALAALRQS